MNSISQILTQTMAAHSDSSFDSPQAREDALGSRIAERAGKNLCAVRRDPGRNYRLRSVREL